MENEYLTLKRQYERLKSEEDKARGVLAEKMRQLKEEFGCETVKAADAMLRSEKHSAKQQQALFEKAIHEFEEKYP